LRLCFSSVEPAAIDDAIAKIADALRATSVQRRANVVAFA
jgi:hypothetical protein